MQQNHINVLISNQYFSWAVYLDTPKSRLHYSRGIGQVKIQYFQCKVGMAEYVYVRTPKFMQNQSRLTHP